MTPCFATTAYLLDSSRPTGNLIILDPDLRGHCQYYGVIFNYRALRAFKDCVVRLWRKTLSKRSLKGRMTWESFKKILTVFPLPEPVIHQAWHR